MRNYLIFNSHGSLGIGMDIKITNVPFKSCLFSLLIFIIVEYKLKKVPLGLYMHAHKCKT